ncbi:DNA starvation/stationary phase protection protein [Persicobacter psychrovividus]|uniref:DNA starvation/stationary phase protection protein n=1 Tax=Persicobacter psychrovividus TaxID=387638 RepID=A0ABM7VIV3_9BACT|nr:DNA starvation/stationary phase protection protein [Persicobacter psychrovividus]
MTIAEKKSLRPFVRLGYTKLETAEIVDKLNKLLANYAVHYQKLRNFHWNVKGADFFEIHERFEQQYNIAKVNIDEIAERIRVFGQRPLSTMQEFLDHAEIKEVHKEMTAMEMVKEILRDYEALLEFSFDVIDSAIENGDSGTEDMMKGYVKQIEKDHWMFTAFSSEK